MSSVFQTRNAESVSKQGSQRFRWIRRIILHFKRTTPFESRWFLVFRGIISTFLISAIRHERRRIHRLYRDLSLCDLVTINLLQNLKHAPLEFKHSRGINLAVKLPFDLRRVNHVNDFQMASVWKSRIKYRSKSYEQLPIVQGTVRG